MKRKLILLLLPLLIFTYSCDSISDGAKNQAKNTKSRIESTKKLIKKNDSTYQAYLKTVGQVGKYSEKEKLQDKFPQALAMMNSSSNIYSKNVEPILDKNESVLEPTLIKYLGDINNLIKESITTSEYPQQRIKLLKSIDDKTGEYNALAITTLANSGKELQGLRSIASPYYSKYPDKKEDIDSIVLVGEQMFTLIKKNSDSIVSNYEKKEAGEDYNLTVIANSYNALMVGADKLKDYRVSSFSKLRELDKSYTKVLKDMKAVFYVQVGRTSWDSYSDYNTDSDHLYSLREVDEETFKYFDGLADNVVLATESGWGDDISVNVNNGMWNKLNINPRESYPGGDDDSEFWLANTEVKYYHNYIVENNGVISEKDSWTEVDEDTFYDNAEHLGMSIVSKPLGFFEDEAMEEAAPAGMPYVGNEKYGEWKKDSNGNDFWSFYGKYMFFSNLLGGNNFSRYEYDDYNRNYRWRDRSYYGSRGQHKYGTRGTSYTNTKSYSSSNYKRSFASNTRSDFGHNNLKKSYRTQAPSARSGSSRRGGGPGSGGK